MKTLDAVVNRPTIVLLDIIHPVSGRKNYKEYRVSLMLMFKMARRSISTVSPRTRSLAAIVTS